MTREELGLEAFVVLGNALHLLVHGVKPEDQQRLALPMEDVRRLHRTLEPLRAPEMVTALDAMATADRRLLHDALALCERLAGPQAEHLLGAPADAREAVRAMLLQTAPPVGGPA